MTAERKSVQNIKTVRALLDARRVRTCGGALMEMSGLANERERLMAELERGVRRQAEIRDRLVSIAEKQERLRRFVESASGAAPSRPLPLADAPHRLITRELNY